MMGMGYGLGCTTCLVILALREKFGILFTKELRIDFFPTLCIMVVVEVDWITVLLAGIGVTFSVGEILLVFPSELCTGGDFCLRLGTAEMVVISSLFCLSFCPSAPCLLLADHITQHRDILFKF